MNLAIARRVFVVVWLVLGIAGALDHTIALSTIGRRIDLVLPHLRYGHVMFNHNLRTVQVHEFMRDDGPRRPLSDLMATPAFGYENARLSLDLLTKPDVLAEICFRAYRAEPVETIFLIDEYEVDAGSRRKTRSMALRCGAHGLIPR